MKALAWIQLLRPRRHALKAALTRGAAKVRVSRLFLFGFVGGAFWLGAFALFFRVLTYFQSVEEFGDILALKLLSMIMITFFTLLIFSSIINSLSHLYLSRDLPLLHSLPIASGQIFYARFAGSCIDSSWMVVIFSLPVFLSFGLIYQAGTGFYLTALTAIILLCLIAQALSSIAVVLGAVLLPAGKIRSLFVILGVMLAIALIVALRLIRPEQLVNPEGFASAVIYLNSLQTLDAPWLPATWITDSLRYALTRSWGQVFFSLSLSLSFFSLLMFINDSLARAFYFKGFSRAQTTPGRLFAPLRFRGKGWETGLFFLSRPARALAAKEIRAFFRDSTQWPQLFLIGALIIIYLYNFSVLPLGSAPVRTVYLQNVFSFLNGCLAAVGLSASAARVVFPAVSMEGEAFWILKAAPVSMRSFLWMKFFLYYLPLLLLTEALIIISNTLLDVTPFMMALSVITIFFLVPAIVALAVGLGAMYPDFTSENPAMSATSFGGLLFMLVCFALIALVIILQAGPVYRIFMADVHGLRLSFRLLIVSAVSFAAAVLLCLFAIFFPMRLAERKLNKG